MASDSPLRLIKSKYLRTVFELTFAYDSLKTCTSSRFTVPGESFAVESEFLVRDPKATANGCPLGALVKKNNLIYYL